MEAELVDRMFAMSHIPNLKAKDEKHMDMYMTHMQQYEAAHLDPHTWIHHVFSYKWNFKNAYKKHQFLFSNTATIQQMATESIKNAYTSK